MTGKDAFVQQLAATFSREERLILTLHYVEDLTPDEIAVVMDLGLSRVEDALEMMQQRTREAVAANEEVIRAA